MNSSLSLPDKEKLLSDASALVSPPSVCVKLFQVLRSSTTSAEDIASIISNDPNLVARVLQIVNSAYFDLAAPVDTLSRAITVLGVRDLSNVVIALSAVRSFAALGGGLLSHEAFWHHSVLVAIIARRLARKTRVADPERLFVAGLLHDVGSALLYGQHPDLAIEMNPIAERSEAFLAAQELARFGFAHPELGAQLLSSWQLPGALTDAIAHHHDKNSPDPLTATLAVAELLAGLGRASEARQDEATLPAFEIPGVSLSSEDYRQIAADSQTECTEALRVFLT